MGEEERRGEERERERERGGGCSFAWRSHCLTMDIVMRARHPCPLRTCIYMYVYLLGTCLQVVMW